MILQHNTVSSYKSTICAVVWQKFVGKMGEIMAKSDKIHAYLSAAEAVIRSWFSESVGRRPGDFEIFIRFSVDPSRLAAWFLVAPTAVVAAVEPLSALLGSDPTPPCARAGGGGGSLESLQTQFLKKF